MKSHRSHNVLLSFLLLFCCGTGSLCADELPTKFVRITSLEDVTEDAWYLIGALNPDNGGFYLMRAQNVSTSIKKIQSTHIDNPLEAPFVQASNPLHYWKFDIESTLQESTPQVSITDSKGNKVTATRAEKDYLELKTDGTATKWIISATEEGFFHFTNPQDGRWLALSTSTNRFGNYVIEVNDLYLFKSINDFTLKPGAATPPVFGTIYTLRGDSLLSATDFTSLSAAPYELSDGTIAYSPTLAQLTARTADDSGVFTLNDESGRTLGHDLTWGSSADAWSVTNGHVTTPETPVRYLAYHAGAFRSMTHEEIEQAGSAQPVTLVPVGEAPKRNLTNGVLTLSGTWNADTLAALSTEDISAIDASALRLPQAARAFRQEIGPNVPIYIHADELACVPEDWNFVVLKNGNSCTLMRPTALQDRCAVHLPFPFSLSTNHLTYTREAHADGAWETLVLPFKAAVPDGFEAQEFVSLENGVLTFREVTEIPSCTPVLLRSLTAGSGMKELIFNAKAGTASTSEAGSGPFLGTFQPLVVASECENLYLLEASGEAFILADEGSRLDPFRAYIRTDSTQGIRLKMNYETTGIEPPTTRSAPDAAPAYTLDGRRASRLRPGRLYITQQKKIIQPLL